MKEPAEFHTFAYKLLFDMFLKFNLPGEGIVCKHPFVTGATIGIFISP